MMMGREDIVTGEKLIDCSILDDQRESFRTVHAGRPEIPHKPEKPSPVKTNGNSHGQQNGKHSLDDEVVEESKGIKRSLPDDDSPPYKKAKIVSSADDVVIVEEAGGAIVIDD